MNKEPGSNHLLSSTLFTSTGQSLLLCTKKYKHTHTRYEFTSALYYLNPDFKRKGVCKFECVWTCVQRGLHLLDMKWRNECLGFVLVYLKVKKKNVHFCLSLWMDAVATFYYIKYSKCYCMYMRYNSIPLFGLCAWGELIRRTSTVQPFWRHEVLCICTNYQVSDCAPS